MCIKFLKFILAFAMLAAVQTASANGVCYTNANQVPAGSPPLFMRDGGFCTTQSGTQATTLVAAPQPVLVRSDPVILHRMPAGHVYDQCSTEQAARRAILIAGASGLAGLLIRDNSEGARKGAGLGLLYAMGTECRIAVPQETLMAQGVRATEGIQGGVRTFDPSDCDVGTVMDRKGLAKDQCDNLRESMKVSEPSDCDVGPQKDMKSLSEAECKRRRDAMIVTKLGHCIVGGVSYPEFIDNEPGCRAKWEQVFAKSNSSVPTEAARRAVSSTEVRVNASTGANVPNVCAWLHPVSKQRFDKPSEDGRPCIDFVKEVAGKNGYTIATRQ